MAERDDLKSRICDLEEELKACKPLDPAKTSDESLS